MKPSPREVAAAHRLGESFLEFWIAVEEGAARRRADRPRAEMVVRVKGAARPAPRAYPAERPTTPKTPPTRGKQELLVGVNEAAARLSMSPRTVWRLVAAGELRVVRIGRTARVPVSELERITNQGV